MCEQCGRIEAERDAMRMKLEKAEARTEEYVREVERRDELLANTNPRDFVPRECLERAEKERDFALRYLNELRAECDCDRLCEGAKAASAERDRLRTENEGLRKALRQAEVALEHCRQRPHIHNPTPDECEAFGVPTTCRVIVPALAAVRAALSSPSTDTPDAAPEAKDDEPSEDVLRDALQRIHKKACGESDRAYMSIPADPKRDADLLLAGAIGELVALRRLSASRQELAAMVREACAVSIETGSGCSCHTGGCAHDEARGWSAYRVRHTALEPLLRGGGK